MRVACHDHTTPIGSVSSAAIGGGGAFTSPGRTGPPAPVAAHAASAAGRISVSEMAHGTTILASRAWACPDVRDFPAIGVRYDANVPCILSRK